MRARLMTRMFISPILKSDQVLIMASGSLATIPANIKSEMPLPIPWSEISSPSHMTTRPLFRD